MTFGFVGRVLALIRKETHQMMRDKSNLAVGLLLPILLILLFGYGLSLDVKHAPIAVVLEDSSPSARQALDGLQGSPFLAPVWVRSMAEAETLMRTRAVDAIVRVPVDFSRQLAAKDARLQLVLDGVDTATATALEGYVSGALAQSTTRQADRFGGHAGTDAGARVEIVQRMWFNEAGNSTWYLVPGLIVIVLTLIGAFLTSLLIAREWENGTLESLFVTPVRPVEIVLAKLVPYVLVGAIDIVMFLLAARFLFEVPLRGSLVLVLATSVLYLVVSLLVGLFISGKTRNQFQASQVALLISFLPATMLSGFVFDLRNVPIAIQVVSQFLPATHFIGAIKTLMLAGTHWPAVLKSLGILGLYAVALFLATVRTLRKTLD